MLRVLEIHAYLSSQITFRNNTMNTHFERNERVCLSEKTRADLRARFASKGAHYHDLGYFMEIADLRLEAVVDALELYRQTRSYFDKKNPSVLNVLDGDLVAVNAYKYYGGISISEDDRLELIKAHDTLTTLQGIFISPSVVFDDDRQNRIKQTVKSVFFSPMEIIDQVN